MNEIGETVRTICDFGSSNNLEVSKSGTVFTLNQFFRYINRGTMFSAYSLYDYTAIVRHKRGLKPTKKSAKKSNAGRPRLQVYPYEGSNDTGCPDSSFGQTISTKITIPIIPGPAPPSYPGNKPLLSDFIDKNKTEDKSIEIEFKKLLSDWTKKAKIFVEFYSILFLPWDANLDPRDPTMPSLKILPWDDNSSWENFKTIFKSWDIDTDNTDDARGWYKRSNYKIFQNMVENMRQSCRARKLMLDWRALAADERSSTDNVNGAKSEKNEVFDHESRSIDEGDDLQIVMEMLRQKHGEQMSATSNALKTKQYLERLHSNLRDIFDIQELNGVEPQTTIPQNETSNEPYLSFSSEECKDMQKKVKTKTTYK